MGAAFAERRDFVRCGAIRRCLHVLCSFVALSSELRRVSRWWSMGLRERASKRIAAGQGEERSADLGRQI